MSNLNVECFKLSFDIYTVSENQCYTPRLTVFCLVHLKNLPVEKMPQMRYHLKALTQSFQNL